MLMNNNYQAWQINPQDFSKQSTDKDRLLFLLNFSVLAPSSHNSQPWRFLIQKNQIDILPNWQRALPISDSDHRQLYISLGCALENLLIAADYYGYLAQIEYTPSPKIAARLKLKSPAKEKQADKNHLLNFITKRVTNRFPYQKTKLPKKFIQKIETFAKSGLKVNLVTNQSSKEKIAEIVNTAMIEAMDNKAFRQELSGYIKTNITKANLGMPLFGMGIPTLPSLIAPLAIKFININQKTKRQDEALLKQHTPAFIIISTQTDNRKDQLQAGQVYERIALEAEKQGLASAVMAAAIQIGDYYKDLQKILGISARPQVFMRLGYPTKPTRHSPRLLAQKVTTFKN